MDEFKGTIRISLRAIEEIAGNVKDGLEREAIRTIRQRNPDRGKVCLDKIDGVQEFLEELRRACHSAFYRQRGEIDIESNGGVLRNHRKTEIKFPKQKTKRPPDEPEEPHQIHKQTG
jgi:hypothetical protein